ncbi:GNAT family N-acetyltransferase [Salinibacterium soli]|uniref:GNAT family N-acetyltransferase n=1 Tax=Antiquaquibacter soli TaxID=3064523 RepID=A0ABT9BQ17_9MICO|nr:GNAT family N-acetyltransferase [Protaetiibacter sp. WY-16]MDO7881891.1 GNAT family N-acetyltransferase [Protaetiibacter sp. WY-16]
MTARELSHEPDEQRYTLRLDGRVAAIADYRVNGNSISFHHTYTQPNLRGRGLAGEVVSFAMDDVEKNSTRRVVPMCWYVADWFDEHPERAGLLTR